jgi:hypothetical protein
VPGASRAPARTADDLVALACERTGISSLDSGSYREGLDRLVAEANACERVTEAGRQGFYEACVSALVNRLRVSEHLRQHPEELQSPIERPLILFGLPRTGSTLSSNLLDQDPARRSLLNWEAVDSVPPPTSETLRSDPRCVAKKREQQAQLEQLPPEMVVHWEWADTPTECMFVVMQDFKADIWASRLPAEDYARWLWFEADLRPTYAYHRRVLQVLQSKAPGTWSLKMPSHALFLDALLEVYPDARLVWTHRDPYTSLASLCNTIAVAESAWTGGNPDLDEIRRLYPMQLHEHVQRAMQVRARIGHERIHDLYYHELMRDPIDAMRRLYGWAGDAFTAEIEARMRRYLEQNPQGKHGSQSYSLEKFGLTRAEVEPLFADYLASYPVQLDD